MKSEFYKTIQQCGSRAINGACVRRRETGGNHQNSYGVHLGLESQDILTQKTPCLRRVYPLVLQLCLGGCWVVMSASKSQLCRISSHQPSLPLSRYGSPGLQSCWRANPSRKPGRPDFPRFPRHLLWPPNKLPLCPLSPGCECLCCGDRACHPLSLWLWCRHRMGICRVHQLSLSLSISAKPIRDTPPAAGPTAPLTVHLLCTLNQVEVLAAPRSWWGREMGKRRR